MNKLTKFLSICALTVFGTSMAQAHTTSIGFLSGANPGDVIFITGSYHAGTAVNEGSLTLVGSSATTVGYNVTKAFNILPANIMTAGGKPAGLIDGTNNFYWSRATLTTPSFLDPSLTVDPRLSGPVASWQAVLFTGLTAGKYDFSCGATCGSTFLWDSWTSKGNGTLTLSGTVVQQPPSGVPEASSNMLLGLGLVGLGFTRRKKQA